MMAYHFSDQCSEDTPCIADLELIYSHGSIAQHGYYFEQHPTHMLPS